MVLISAARRREIAWPKTSHVCRTNSRRARRAVHAGLGVDAEGLPATIGRHVIQGVRNGLVVRIGERDAATAAPLRVDLPAVVISVDLADDSNRAKVVRITGLRSWRERRGTRDGEKGADKEKKKTPSQKSCELRGEHWHPPS
jgi:hypothetical protein